MYLKNYIPFIVSLFFMMECQPKKEVDSPDVPEISADEKLRDHADSLAHAFIITDGHVDLPYRLQKINFDPEKDKNISMSSRKGDFDYERAKLGGLDAPFMSIYIPSTYQVTGGARELADRLINMVQGIIQAHPDKFGEGKSPEQVEQNFRKGLISLPLGLENGAPLGSDLANIQYFFDRGIRYITLTHGKDNLICDSSYDTTRTWNGLSPFGKKVVKEMNRVGIMVDVSHVSDNSFYQVMEISTVPVIASHSSCRHFTPGWERNMSDDMIKKLAEKGGVIQINIGSSFLNRDIKNNRKTFEDTLKARSLDEASPEASQVVEEFRQKNLSLFANIDHVADHIDRVVEIAGIDHVGIGTDFDGVGDSLPEGLKDVSQYPNLIYTLLKRGYSDEDIEKICYKNVWRVWNKVLAASAR